MSDLFRECSVCARQSGSPTLCPSCLHNRDVINRLQDTNTNIRKEEIETKDPGFEFIQSLFCAMQSAGECCDSIDINVTLGQLKNILAPKDIRFCYKDQ